MTKFIKDRFVKSHGFVSYDGKFVVRFNVNQKGAASSFCAFLIAKFTTEEYFDRLDAGESPLVIVEQKGYRIEDQINRKRVA